MSRRGELSKARRALFFAPVLLAGCRQDARPDDGLPLRDALRVAPEVVAIMSIEPRRDLAKPFDVAGLDAKDPPIFELPGMLTIKCNDNWSNKGSKANGFGGSGMFRAATQSLISAPIYSGFWNVARAAYLLLRGRRRT